MLVSHSQVLAPGSAVGAGIVDALVVTVSGGWFPAGARAFAVENAVLIAVGVSAPLAAGLTMVAELLASA